MSNVLNIILQTRTVYRI